MNDEINKAAHCYIVTLWGKPICFVAILHQAHFGYSMLKRVHRIVVLPDYQGIGIGINVLEYIGKLYLKQGAEFHITTSHPALNRTMARRNNWKLMRMGRFSRPSTGYQRLDKSLSINRNTCSWALLKNYDQTKTIK